MNKKKSIFMPLFTLLVAFSLSFSALIDPQLVSILEKASTNQKIPVDFVLKERKNALELDPTIENLPRPQRRARVGRVLMDFAERTQRDLLNYLREKEKEGKVEHIISLWIVNLVGCLATPDVIYEVANRQDIDLVLYAKVPVELAPIKEVVPKDITESIQPNLERINVRGAWKQGYTGQGVVIGVVDTGVRYTHLDLANHLWHSDAYPNCGFNVASYQMNFGHPGPSNYDTLTPLDFYGHGTHCAGITSADGTYGNGTHDTMGVAPSALIMSVPVDVYVHSPYPDTSLEKSMWFGIQFCIRPPRDTLNGADVITMSLGLISSWLPRRRLHREVEEQVLAAGIVHCVAAGNEGSSKLRVPGNCPPPYPHPQNVGTGAPSAVISVGATDNNDNIASFSSRGPTRVWDTVPPWYDYSPYLVDPDVCAPGVDILSTYYSSDQSYTQMSGTSMATPHVAGLCALMLSKNPYLTPRQIDSIIEHHAVVDLGAPGKDTVFGSGRINCSLAVAFTPPPTGVRYYKHTILDTPPLGNGDGILNPGESCEMPTWLKNLCSYPAQGVRGILRRTFADPNVTISDTVKYFGTIQPGDSAWTGNNGFNISVAVACTNGYLLPLELVVKDTTESTWVAGLGIRVGAPVLTPYGIIAYDSPPGGNGNGKLDPGEVASIAIGIKNIGIGNGYNVYAVLKSGDPRFIVLDSFGLYDTVYHDSTKFNTVDKFRVNATSAIPREFPVPCTLKIYGLNYSAVRAFNIIVGEITAVDPIPDGPRTPARYYAYDDIDTFYLEAPRFNWIEIRNRGTQLPITSDDQTIRIPLPFVFKYYGIRYTDSLSVCGNGWISPIRTTSTVYTNQPLPDPTSSNPSAMICPVWDDLYPPVGNRIWYLYEPDSHRFILEWDSVHYFSAREQWDKFQIIVYDTTNQTYTGDNEFIFQYLTANNYGSITIGIEDETNQIGINALYNGTYHRACAPVVPGRAIKFTTDTIAMRVGMEEVKLEKVSRMRLPTVNRKNVELILNLTGNKPVRISIYDVTGREVKNFSINPPIERLTWDGKDTKGTPVSEGIYLIRLATEEGSEIRKVVYLK